MTHRYHATRERDGTEDQIDIRTPDGESLAVIWFWDDDPQGSAKARAAARLIVSALNAHRPRRRRASRSRAGRSTPRQPADAGA